MGNRFATLFWGAVLITFGIGLIMSPAPPASAEQTGDFKGTWIASGKRRTLGFAADREVFTFELQGHVNLQDNVGNIRDFWSECIGLWDSQTGGTSRCVWRSVRGHLVYAVLNGELLKEGVAVKGTFVGGTDEADGIEGGFTLTWKAIFRNGDEDVITVHSTDLAGTYRIP